MVSWAGSHLGPSRSCFCYFPNAIQEKGEVGLCGKIPKEVCVHIEAGAIFQNWLLTANDQMLIMPRKLQFLNGLSEGPPKGVQAVLGGIGQCTQERP